ncbi:unnamed protein product [Blumeria hordei]|uniref:Uncharacterized protein n=1 Tax=Blumeria hordei TaxID=2867405 RepID=A0A383UN70_BLUHO|nr:unnamed protein product [Blumeria hordei]
MEDTSDTAPSTNLGPEVAINNVNVPMPSFSNMAMSSQLKKESEIMNSILYRITNYRDADGHDVSKDFQRLVNKRVLPDYFDIIKEPMAFSTIRSKIVKKQYTGFKGFVRDFALISHNAQVYNRPSALVYGDSLALLELFKSELQKLVDAGTISSEDAEIPYLGEIPEVEDSSPRDLNDEEAEAEEEDDDDDDVEETEDERNQSSRGKRQNSSIANKGIKIEDGTRDDPETLKKRGRPPKVHTPMEARIDNILRGLRKFKNPNGENKILPFEKLPDKTIMPEYYQEIKQPVALDLIKRKAKRKKYNSVDQVLKDIDLMFENAKLFNLEESQVYKDAVYLQDEVKIIAEEEKNKPDSDFVDEDGRLPLSEIFHNGESWKVGDWIHLANPNDVTKPIVAQIYRTWQGPDGLKWINACWYYRPEQTVHNHEKHFFENEVMKTSQYRDHRIEEIIDRCFVMFFTRYNKGRPRGLPPNKEVYICEARYNEETFKLNKIKTWASCIPDEVREKDYEMDLFDIPKKMKKVPSPIKHLLREDAKENDPLPKPTWGGANAPPIVGAVHKIPRGPNESPPPEQIPTPPPPELIRRSFTADRPRAEKQGDILMTGLGVSSSILPATVKHGVSNTSYNNQTTTTRATPSPALAQPTPYISHAITTQAPTIPAKVYQNQSANIHNQYAPITPLGPQPTKPLNVYSHYQNSNAKPSPIPAPINSYNQHSNVYNPTHTIEVYTLPDTANSSIPADIRDQFHKDDSGRVIFFTTPPIDVNPIVEETQVLCHSLKYLADKARRRDEDNKKRKAREINLEFLNEENSQRLRNNKTYTENYIAQQGITAIKNWSLELEKETAKLYDHLID